MKTDRLYVSCNGYLGHLDKSIKSIGHSTVTVLNSYERHPLKPHQCLKSDSHTKTSYVSN
jgi:hypothetical protein